MEFEPKIKCKECGEELQALNPPVEDYVNHKFCIKLFGFKLMLIKDKIDYGCTRCIIDERDSRARDDFGDAVGYAIQKEVEKGNLIYRD